MHVQLDRVRERPFEWNETLGIEPERLGHPDLLSLGPVRWEGRVAFVDPGFLMTASYGYEQTLRCLRCLESVKDRVDDRLELLLLTDPPPETDGETELEEQELGVIHVGEEEIDVDQFLLEQIDLGVPMRPLCRSDCAGLCASCGANLNQETCDCEAPTGDSRWEALAGLGGRPSD